ncbi:MAG: DUF4332 domain-containing protein [Anaerolineaceae bacterium]|nr:DUF4332 domain-containing protein [Anaerolineaceae bacterium]
MSYHIDDEQVTLTALRKRIESNDLVPSRVALLDGITEKFELLETQGIRTFDKLRYELKNPKRLNALATASKIDQAYLVLLRREIESYFPKPFKLTEFTWMPQEEIQKLVEHGLNNSAAFYEATMSDADASALQVATNVDAEILQKLRKLVNLTRVQWVSPNTARMIILSGYSSAAELAAADADELAAGLNRVNEGGRFYKGKIGMRDIKRLIHAAGYVG